MTKSIEEQADEYATQLEKNHYATETLHPASYYAGVDVGYEAGAKARDAEIEQLKAENICKDLKITIQHDKITALKSKLEIAKKGLEFYAECGEIWSSPTVDADGDFDGAVFKFSGENGLKETARQALKEINDAAVFAKCEYCKKTIEGHLAEHYKDIEVFCSLKCNQEYEG